MYLSTLSPSGVLIHSCFFTQSAQEQERSVVTYRPHSRPIGHIVVPPTHPLTVYSCSYDSTLRCCHIEKGVFEEVGCLLCLLISLFCASAIWGPVCTVHQLSYTLCISYLILCASAILCFVYQLSYTLCISYLILCASAILYFVHQLSYTLCISYLILCASAVLYFVHQLSYTLCISYLILCASAILYFVHQLS